jgi:hypothetical protein
MVDLRYVFSLRRVENDRSAVLVVTGIVNAKQKSLASSGKSSWILIAYCPAPKLRKTVRASRTLGNQRKSSGVEPLTLNE